MKQAILQIEGWMSCLDARGIEKRLMAARGVHHVEASFMSGTATVHYDESQASLADLKKLVADCGCECTGESLPQHIVKPSDPPVAATMDHSIHAGHTTPMPAKAMEHGEHAGHAVPMPTALEPIEHAGHEMVSGEMAGMAHEMGHGVGMSMDAMVRDMRNRFLVALIFAVPILVY